MELVIFLIAVWAVSRAWKDSKDAYRKSKSAYTEKAKKRFPDAPKSRRAATALRHDVGYWASQLLGGFPVARHGLAVGWHQGRGAQSAARTAREEARTRRLENQAGHAERLSGFRERQQEALRRWREAMNADRERPTEGTVTGEGSEGSGEGTPAAPADGGSYSWGLAGMPYQWPDDKESAHRQARHASTDGRPHTVTSYPAGGGPGTTDAAYLNGTEFQPTADQASAWDAEADLRRQDDIRQGRVTFPPHAPAPADSTPIPRMQASAQADDRPKVTSIGTIGVVDGPNGPRLDLQGWAFDRHPLGDGDHDGIGLEDAVNGHTVAELHEMSHGPGCQCPVAGVAEPVFPATPSTQGEAMSARTADVTYDGVLASMAAERNDAEQRAAELQQAAQRASAASEQMQALDVDPSTLSAMADHLDAHDAATKAQQHVQETAEAVEAALKHGHSGLAEAHQSAPVQAADREFYAG